MYRTAVGFTATLIVLTAVVLTGSPASAADDGDTWVAIQSNETELDPDEVVLEVGLRPDGSAHWAIRYRVRLANQSVTDAFEAVRTDIEANRLERAGEFKLRMEPVVAAARNETGRRMELQEVTVTTDRRRPPGAIGTYGVVTYEFVWTHFAMVEDGQIRMDDILVDFFLTEDVTMLVTWPDGYQVTESIPSSEEPESGMVVWTGPKEFSSDGPEVLVERTEGGAGLSVPVSPVGFAAVALLCVALVAGWYRTRARQEEASLETPSVEPATETETSEPPEALLSDEERVIRLLKDNGGRMKQQAVVEQLDWSETKTSQVVSDLHEADKIERYRLGRENVLALPGEIDI